MVLMLKDWIEMDNQLTELRKCRMNSAVAKASLNISTKC